MAVTAGGGAVVSFDFDEGSYGGFGLVSDYSLPSPVYFGFSGRTGGATNNQYAIYDFFSKRSFLQNITAVAVG